MLTKGNYLRFRRKLLHSLVWRITSS